MKIVRSDTSFTVTDFIINKKYPYDEFTRNDDPAGRTYNVGEHKIPSVTTILSKTQSQEKKRRPKPMAAKSWLRSSCTDHEPGSCAWYGNALHPRTVLSRYWVSQLIA